jgi:CRP-like cAMP-binding protein
VLSAKLRSNEVRFSSSTAAAGRVIFRPGKSADDIYVLCEGWAFTYFRLPDGRRQIFALLLPGDIFSSRMILGKEEYMSVASVTEVRYARINAADFFREAMKSPEMLKNAAACCAQEMQRCLETMVDLGQRNGEERLASFLMRLAERLDAIAVDGPSGRYPFPIRQSEIADAVSLTPVHVSRVMTKFRKEALIDVLWGELVIKNRSELHRRALTG